MHQPGQGPLVAEHHYFTGMSELGHNAWQKYEVSRSSPLNFLVGGAYALRAQVRAWRIISPLPDRRMQSEDERESLEAFSFHSRSQINFDMTALSAF